MIVLDWIGQIVLFFILWRLLMWGTEQVLASGTTMLITIVVDVVSALVLLIVVHATHNAWWVMAFAGAVIGVMTGVTLAAKADTR